MTMGSSHTKNLLKFVNFSKLLPSPPFEWKCSQNYQLISLQVFIEKVKLFHADYLSNYLLFVYARWIYKIELFLDWTLNICNWNSFLSYLYFIFIPLDSHNYDFQSGKGFRKPTIVMFHSKRLRWCSAERASSSKI